MRNKGSKAVRRARAARANEVRNRTVRLYALVSARDTAPAPVATLPTPTPVPVPVGVGVGVAGLVEHQTAVVERDGKHWPECSCGWALGHGLTERGAKGQATRHRNSEQAQQEQAQQRRVAPLAA
jgi:hypothetical protein